MYPKVHAHILTSEHTHTSIYGYAEKNKQNLATNTRASIYTRINIATPLQKKEEEKMNEKE